MTESSRWKVGWYIRARGDSPPREYYKALSGTERAVALRHFESLKKLGPKIEWPQSEHLEGPIWQLRPMSHRFLYFHYDGPYYIILHAFRKKTQKTPSQDLDLAFRRMHELIERLEER